MSTEEDTPTLPEPQATPHGSSRPNTIDQGAREESLRAELAGVRKINTVIEGVVASLEKAKNNMETVSNTVTSANTLLDLWIRIISQTEHTQRLLLSGHWQGATKDLDDIEAEMAHKAQEAERRREQERERIVERERAVAETEARKNVEKKPAAGRGMGTRGMRGMRKTGPSGRGGSRIAPPPTLAGGWGSLSGSRTTRGTGIGRGVGSGRGVS